VSIPGRRPGRGGFDERWRQPHIQTMSILKIARIGHPVLTRIAEARRGSRGTADSPPGRRHGPDHDRRQRAGLAAPQVHVPLRVLVFQAPQERSQGQLAEEEKFDHTAPLTVLINPEIEILGSEMEGGWEGCLSIPGLRGFVERPAHIRYRGLDGTGREIARTAKGFHARVVQHECDHPGRHSLSAANVGPEKFSFSKPNRVIGPPGRAM